MAYALPQDNYDTYLAAPAASGDATLTVNVAPTKTAGVLTIYETDGRTIREKIYYTGVSGTTLTGVVRGIRFTDTAGVVLFTADATLAMDHPSGARIAMTDNIHYLGVALAALNGDMEMGGVMQLPASRTINSSRDVVDKEYVDALSAGTMSQLLVTKNGADPTLTVNVASGRFGLRDQTSALYAGAAAQAVTANQTNYIELTATGSGTLVINTSGFTTGRIPLAIAVADGSGITSLTDARQFFIMHDGLVDQVRTWSTVQSLTADNLQITSDADSDNDPVRRSYLRTEMNAFGWNATSGEAINAGEWVYVKASDGKVWKTDADADESTYSVVGVALTTVAAADLTVRIARVGAIVTGLTGLTAGSYYYLSGTAGAIATSPHATRIAKVAQALSTTSLRVIEPKFRRTGTISITSATTFATTIGFYAGKITFRAAGTNTGISIGDDSNNCVRAELRSANNNGSPAAFAWSCIDANAGATTNQGSLTARDQTSFTVTCSTYAATITLQYDAESL